MQDKFSISFPLVLLNFVECGAIICWNIGSDIKYHISTMPSGRSQKEIISKNIYKLTYCTLAFESATFSWLLLFITKYRASSKKSSKLNFFFPLEDDALATLLLMWSRLSIEELSLSSLDLIPTAGETAFLFLLFTFVLSSCSFRSFSLAFSKANSNHYTSAVYKCKCLNLLHRV